MDPIFSGVPRRPSSHSVAISSKLEVWKVKMITDQSRMCLGVVSCFWKRLPPPPCFVCFFETMIRHPHTYVISSNGYKWAKSWGYDGFFGFGLFDDLVVSMRWIGTWYGQGICFFSSI